MGINVTVSKKRIKEASIGPATFSFIKNKANIARITFVTFVKSGK